MSAHREPDTVADYAKNAQMRGLRVIIAGAGLSAALPGVVAAHTELPVIGVPLTSSKSVAGGLDALLSIAQMPPGVPVGLRRRRQRAQRRRARRAHTGRVIARYTRAELGAIWTDEARMTAWRDVEVAAAEALDGPVDADLEAIRGATFTVEAVKEREAVTDHDVAAFVDVLSRVRGPGRPLDPLRADLLRRARHGARAAAPARRRGRSSPARASWPPRWPSGRASTPDTLCVGRTHGVHAEPTSFGLKLAGFALEAHRNAERLERAFAQAATGAISGAVGTYASLGPAYEARVLERLGLAAEPVSTQVVPRDRHAELLSAIALAGAGLERFAQEIRHLQRTEVREVEEPFRAGQKGSSAMPHKRNPITTERICGLARVLRGYAQTGLENVALWHERDISHSGAERVVLPDATILLDYMQHLALRVARGMVVHADRMAANLELTSGALFSQRVLLALVEHGTAARRRLPDRPAAGPAGVGHFDAAADAARAGARRRARPRRGVRLQPLHPSRARGARARLEVILMTDTLLIYGVAGDVAGPLPRDPGRDHRPVPLRRDERPARRHRRPCSTPTRSTPMGIEILDPFDLGADELLQPRHQPPRGRARAVAPRLREDGRRARAGAAGVPGRPRRPPARERDRAVRRPRAVREPPAGQDRGRDRGHPPRAARGRRGDGGRRADDPRGRDDERGGPRGDAGGLRRARLRPARRRHRLPRPAVGDRPRGRPRRRSARARS